MLHSFSMSFCPRSREAGRLTWHIPGSLYNFHKIYCLLFRKIKQLNLYFNAKAQKNKEEIHIFLCISSIFFQNPILFSLGIVHKDKIPQKRACLPPIFNKAFPQYFPHIPYNHKSILVNLVDNVLKQDNLFLGHHAV